MIDDMTPAEQAALSVLVATETYPTSVGRALEDRARAIVAAVEPLVRADERANLGTAKAQRADGTGPFVEITQVGRWTYDVGGVVNGVGIWMRMTAERVWGRRRAERRALKRLAEYRREQQRCRDVVVVRDDGPTTVTGVHPEFGEHLLAAERRGVA